MAQLCDKTRTRQEVRSVASNEAKVKFIAETGKFNEAISSADKKMQLLRAEAKLNATQLEETGTTVEGLENKHDNLQRQLEVSIEKKEALNQKLRKAIEYYGENSNEAIKYKVQVINAQNAEEKLRQTLNQCEEELEQQKAALENTENATETLSETVKRQQKEVNELKDEYIEIVHQYGETSEEARKLEKDIHDLSGELKQNKEAMSGAASRANELDQSLGKADDEGKEAAEGFTVLKGTLADLASEGIQWAISKLGELASYMAELPEQTREFRQDLATLDTSFDNAGLSAEEAENSWKDLYAVFGEDDRAVETANNISKMADNQEELSNWVTITTGIWGDYQDSLPVEGLAEASNETAKTGKVTGVLADALNWTSESAKLFAEYIEEGETAEDGFNKALAECTDEQERQQLITETLIKLYGESAETYRETAAAQMDAKEAAAEHMLVEAELAAAVEPVTAEFTKLKTELMEGAQPAVETMSSVMLDAIGWMREHPTTVKAVAAAVSVLAIGLGGLAVATGIYTAAQWAMNSALLANPITWIAVGIVAAIAAIVAGGVALYENWETIETKGQELWNTMTETFSSIKENVTEKIEDTKESVIGAYNEIKSGVEFVGNALENTVQEKLNSMKNAYEKHGGGITGIMAASMEGVKGIYSAGYTFIDTLTGGKLTAIKNKFESILSNAGEIVKEQIDKIKGFFDFSWSLPKLKLPHISISGKFSIDPLSVPKFSISWHELGGIFVRPTVLNTPGGLHGFGEAGPEAILPINKLEEYVVNAIEKTQRETDIGELISAITDLASRPIGLIVNGRNYATAIAGDCDSVNGLRTSLMERGLVLE